MIKLSELSKELKNRDMIYFLIRKGYVNPIMDSSKSRDKYAFTEEDAQIIRAMFKEYEINNKKGKKEPPDEIYEKALEELELDHTAKLRIRFKKQMELVWGILKNGKDAEHPVPVIESAYKKMNKKLNSGLEGLELKTKEHHVFFVNKKFPDYEQKIINMAKTALKNGEFIWIKLVDENKQDYENAFAFAENGSVVTSWSELTRLLKDKIWDAESLKEDIIDKLLDKLIKKKANALRIFCDEASKMLQYVRNPEGYLAFEGNWQLALSKANLPFLTLCSYRENELREFLSRDKKTSWANFKKLVDAHDRVVYFRGEGEIFFDNKAIIRMIEDNFAGINDGDRSS